MRPGRPSKDYKPGIFVALRLEQELYNKLKSMDHTNFSELIRGILREAIKPRRVSKSKRSNT
jgi:hypothetical protein